MTPPPQYYILGLQPAPTADVHGHWKARTTASNGALGAEDVIYHYNVVVCPERLLQVGQNVRVLLLSDERFHRLAKKGGKKRVRRDQEIFGNVRRCDAYDQGIEGPVVGVERIADGAATMIIRNTRCGSPITLAHITVPVIPHVTVLLDPGEIRRAKDLEARAGQGVHGTPGFDEGPSLDMGLMTTGKVFMADMQRWKWVEEAGSDDEEECSGMASGDGQAEDEGVVVDDTTPPPSKRRRRDSEQLRVDGQGTWPRKGSARCPQQQQPWIPPPPWWQRGTYSEASLAGTG
ncbi:hypothetical protein C8Q76DRAFT_791445 [Earliella scabrosa]|nr:hypothetical protein C8Q76DRAFT_791445 [Earliella scabrosa]